MALLPQLGRLSPSSADSLSNCPWQWYQLRVERAAEKPTNVPMVRGSVFHEAMAELLTPWVRDGIEPTPDRAGAAVGRAAAGRLPMYEMDHLIRALLHICHRPPAWREDVLLIEPARIGANGIPEPAAHWPAICEEGGRFSIWGIPDLVSIDDDGTPTIWDWKTGWQPQDPDGFAPYIYAVMLEANWHLLADRHHGREFRWPVRVIWRFVAKDEDIGFRELLVYPERADAMMAALDALVAKAEGWVSAGVAWAQMVNRYCSDCPFRSECDELARWAKANGAEDADLPSLARAWCALEQDRKDAERCRDAVRDQLNAAHAAGMEFTFPDGMVIAPRRVFPQTWSARSADDLTEFRELCRRAGIDPDESHVIDIDGKRATALGLAERPEFARFHTPDGEAHVRYERKAVA